MCITQADRTALEQIARREDRDLGYLAGWFLQWGIEQYLAVGASLVTLKSTKVVRDKQIRKDASERLVLRKEAQFEDEQITRATRQKKRA